MHYNNHANYINSWMTPKKCQYNMYHIQHILQKENGTSILLEINHPPSEEIREIITLKFVTTQV